MMCLGTTQSVFAVATRISMSDVGSQLSHETNDSSEDFMNVVEASTFRGQTHQRRSLVEPMMDDQVSRLVVNLPPPPSEVFEINDDNDSENVGSPLPVLVMFFISLVHARNLFYIKKNFIKVET